jgi:hypothetical protein
MELSQATRELIRQMVEADVEYLPKQLGIDHVISGCIVVNLDPYGVGVGVTPRYIQVALRGEYYIDVFYRGGVTGIAVGTELNIFHLSEGDRYEVLGPGGAIGSISGGANPRYWLADNGGFTDFEPDNPAVITSAGVVTEYASIVAAIAAANSGEYVVIPPGTYDESITLKDGVKVVELSTGTVVINSISADIAVTTISGGYIDVKEIRVTRTTANPIYAVVASHAAGSCTIRAETICADNQGTGDVFGVYQTGAGTLICLVDFIQAYGVAEWNEADNCIALYAEAGIQYAWMKQALAHGRCAWTIGARAEGTSVQYIHGECRAEDDEYCIGASCSSATQTIWGDCIAYTTYEGGGTNYCYGISASNGGTQTVSGRCYAYATLTEAFAITAEASATQVVRGSALAECPGGLGYGVQATRWFSAGLLMQTLYGDATGTGSTGIGACLQGMQFGDDTIVQRVHGDVIGDDYGAAVIMAAGGGSFSTDIAQVITDGRAVGGTYDLYRTAGILYTASVQYDSYSGTITLLPESLNALQLAAVPTTELTIAGGIITKTQTYHRIDTEGDAATDDLDTINGATATGEVLIIRAENAGRAVVVKHNTGNIWFMGAADITLDNVEDHLLLIWDGTKWCSLGDGGGGGAGGAHNLLSATHTDTSPAAAAQGYIIRGNSTPLWERYDASTAGQVLIGDGSDVVSEVFVRFGAVEPVPTWPGMIWVNTA